MKTRLNKIFNIIKWAPIVVFGVGVVLNIISGDYYAAMLNLCLIVMCWLILSLFSDLENTMELANAYKKAYERECELFEKEALILRKEILDEAVDSKKLAEDMLRIFNNVDKMYKRYENTDQVQPK